MQLKLLMLLLFCSALLKAQDSTQLFIPAGKSIAESVPPQKQYRYPNFMNGEIRFRDGSISHAKLNYNFLNGEVEFISPKNDTLAIAKDQMLNIKQVVIDSSNFYFDNGYLEEVAAIPSGKLLKRQLYKIWKREKIGGYGQPTSTAAIDSYSSFAIEGQFQPNLKVMQDVTLLLRSEYYVSDQYLSAQRVTKKNITKVFPQKKNLIETYLKNNVVDFTSEKDLVKMLAYINTASN